MFVSAANTSHGYFSRAAFISLRTSDCSATIRGQCLFQEIQYASLCEVILHDTVMYPKLMIFIDIMVCIKWKATHFVYK